MNPPGNAPQEILLHDFQQLFLFDDIDETIEFCIHCGLKIINSMTKEIYHNNSNSSRRNTNNDKQFLVVLINGQNIDNLLPRYE